MSYIIEYVTEGSGEFIIDSAGENLGKHKLVYRNALDTWSLADADSVLQAPVVGLTLEAIPQGQKGKILTKGYVANNGWVWVTGGSAGKIYMSQTAGELTQTQPGAGSVNQCVAVAFSQQAIWFDPAGLGSMDILSGLTAGRVPIIGAGGVLTDDAEFTYDPVTDTLTVTNVDVEGYYLDGVDVTDVLEYPVTEASYIVFQETVGGVTTYYAKNGTDGRIQFSGGDVAVVRLAAIAALPGGNGMIADKVANTITFYKTGLPTIIIDGDGGILNVDTINESTAGAGVTIEGVLVENGDAKAEGQVYGVEWNQSTDTWTQIDIDGNAITPTATDFNNHEVWGNIIRVNLSPGGIVNARWGDGDYASDGSNGQVMVEIPCFYVKGEQTTPNVYQWWISRVPLTGFEVHPAFLQRDGRIKAFIYIGAYEASLMVGTGIHDASTTLKLHTRSGEQPWTGGEIDALPYNTGSVEFTRGETLTGAISGGTGIVIDWYVSAGAWGTGNAAGKVYIKQNTVNFQAEGLAGSVSGVANATGVQVAEALTIGNARTYGGNQGAGWGIMNIWSLSAVKLLFIIEYGNMDSQVEVGRGIVDKAGGSGFAGEETAAAGVDGNLDAAGTGVGTGVNGLVPATYRYMENLWGNVWAFIDGYNALDAAYRLIPRDGDGTFADALVTFESSSMAPITSDGYISNIEWDRVMKYLFIAKATGGSSSTHIPDYQYSHDVGETNILLAGGAWDLGSIAGLGCLSSANVATYDLRGVGARAEYAP